MLDGELLAAAEGRCGRQQSGLDRGAELGRDNLIGCPWVARSAPLAELFSAARKAVEERCAARWSASETKAV